MKLLARLLAAFVLLGASLAGAQQLTLDLPIITSPAPGGGSSGITGGTTTVTTCGDGRVLFDDGGVVGCDAGLVFNKTTDVVTATGGTVVGSAGSRAWSTDLFLFRDAANTLALRNGAAAQTLRVYNTTDGVNTELGTFNWSTVANRLTIGPVAAGTGTLRSIGFTSHVLWNTDAAHDIGASGANRPRHVYASGNATFGGGGVFGAGLVMSGAQVFQFSGVGGLYFESNGVLTLLNNAQTDFNRLQLGCGTALCPSIKRSAAILQVRLANDSANAALEAATLDTDGFTVAGLPAAGVAGRQVYVTDQLTACTTTGGAITGGGEVICPVFDNGTAWVGG